MNTIRLSEKWTVSHAKDTEGYNICTVKDIRGTAKGQCNGGGYDMAGTSLANCLENVGLNNGLLNVVTPENASYVTDYRKAQGEKFTCNEPNGHVHGSNIIYGTYYTIDTFGYPTVTIDGATGRDNIISVYALVDVEITPLYEARNKSTRTGYIVSTN